MESWEPVAVALLTLGVGVMLYHYWSLPSPPGPREADIVLDVIRRRRSVYPKDYAHPTQAEPDIGPLLEAARWAPNHGKEEPWRFVVYTGAGRTQLIDATRAWYAEQPAEFWKTAWDGEFEDSAAFAAHLQRQTDSKWLRCTHLISICMARSRKGIPDHEDVAAVSCAVQNMHLCAAALGLGAYWSSWFAHFAHSDAGVRLHGLDSARGDRWLGVFCVGPVRGTPGRGLARRQKSVRDVTRWVTTAERSEPSAEPQ